MKEIRKALKALSITGKITVKKYDSYTLVVYVDGKKFGLWDTTKNTFVE